jgi:nitroreductase
MIDVGGQFAMIDQMLPRFVDFAIKAPSSHNTQPWSFRIADDTIELRADRSRALPVNDPADRELTISCGAALFNLRIAAQSAGFDTVVERFPEPSDADLVARVRFRPDGGARDRPLFGAIDVRRTHRKVFLDRDPPEAVIQHLVVAAADEGAMLKVVDEASRSPLATLVRDGDRLLFADRRWRRELARWMRSRRHGDGLTVAPLVGAVIRRVVTTFDVGASVAAKNEKLVRGAPVLAVLTTDGDSRLDWLAAGQALEHVLLAAAAEGMQASYLNQPCQVAVLRPRLRQLVSDGSMPQLVLRIGYPSDEGIEPTPRRPLEAVLERPCHG